MKKILKDISPFLFDEYLILSLSKNWIKLFGEIPKFDVMLNKDGKLILKSTKSISYTKYTK